MLKLLTADRHGALQEAAIARHAVRALLRELDTWPKPGLVSLADNGSHDDMDARHFVASARALRRWFATFASAGAAGADFVTLRRLGVEAEVSMTRATGAINTHRGAIFLLGLLAAAGGARPGVCLGATVRARWGSDIANHRRDPSSHGSAATRRFGAGGAQQEAAGGFPSVYAIGLPAYRQALALGIDPSLARVQAFFHLLAAVDDTNLLHRGGLEGLRFAQASARDFIREGGVRGAQGLRRAHGIHREFVARRLSAGGCADLLAATLFVHSIEGGTP